MLHEGDSACVELHPEMFHMATTARHNIFPESPKPDEHVCPDSVRHSGTDCGGLSMLKEVLKHD